MQLALGSPQSYEEVFPHAPSHPPPCPTCLAGKKVSRVTHSKGCRGHPRQGPGEGGDCDSKGLQPQLHHMLWGARYSSTSSVWSRKPSTALRATGFIDQQQDQTLGDQILSAHCSRKQREGLKLPEACHDHIWAPCENSTISKEEEQSRERALAGRRTSMWLNIYLKETF